MMGKYRVNKSVAVLKGNKVTVYHPSEEFVNIDDASAKELSENVDQVGKEAESEVPADRPDTQAANASRGKAK